MRETLQLLLIYKLIYFFYMSTFFVVFLTLLVLCACQYFCRLLL